MNYKELILNNPKYSFLKENEHLGNNIMLLTLGGSHSYGLEQEDSDLDVRGITLERQNELLGLDIFEKFENKDTDTTIYAFRKMIKLLLSCNPNCIEILATNPEHILIMTEEGKLLRNNIELFLSQMASRSFSGYARRQLRRLKNALARDSYTQPEKEEHIFQSINIEYLKEHYADFTDEEINLYIDKSDKEDFETELFLDINLKHYPLREFRNIQSIMNNVIIDYGNLHHRNRKKDDVHLNKHISHLFRLYIMGAEILEGKGVYTYRNNDKDFLLDLKNGKYVIDDKYNFIEELLKPYIERFEYAKQNSPLPVKPDYNKINELTIEINRRAIK
jgi:predicted nucleotidyltransferase